MNANDTTLENLITSESLPVLVDFWADWCRPCKMLAPTIDALATEYNDKVKVCKANIEDSSAFAKKHSINSIPTVLLFHKGQVVNRFNGIKSLSEYKQAIDAIS